MKASKCILYTRDENLRNRVAGLLGRAAELTCVSDGSGLVSALEQQAPTVVWFDILNPDWREHLSEIRRNYQDCLVILLGDDRTDPVIEAGDEGIFHVESPDCPRKRFQQVFRMAQKHLLLLKDQESLRRQRQEAAANVAVRDKPDSGSGGAALREALGSFSKIDDLDELLSRSLSFIKDYHAVGSLGVFLSDGQTEPYTVRATVKCPREVSSLHFSMGCPLVKRLRLHPSVIDHRAIDELEAHDMQLAHSLRSSLNEMLANAVFPLYGSRDLLGWLFVGRSTFGKVIQPEGIASISVTADQLAFSVENSMLHARINRQREHFEHILNALSIGIILFDDEHRILWVNDAASQITGRRCDDLVLQPCKTLGSELAAMMFESAPKRGEIATFTWSPGNSDREYLAEVHGNEPGAANPCGFLFLQDFTPDPLNGQVCANGGGGERVLNLASSISTELRAPLVAIQTFVQLLPERYRDADFREKFIDLVTGEIGRLENLSKELEGVRVPEGDRSTETVDAWELLHEAVEQVSESGVIDQTEVCITGGAGISIKVIHSESLVESLGGILEILGADPAHGDSARIWVDIYFERGELGGPQCVYSFRSEGAVLANVPDENLAHEIIGSGSRDWDSLKTMVATLGGKVNYGYNKNRSFITLQLPIH